MSADAFAGVKAIYFDVDDTLYDFEESMRHAFVHLHKTFPDVFGQHKVEQVSDAYWEFYKSVPEAQKVGLINTDPDRFRRTMWAGALAGLGHGGDLDPAAKRIVDEMQRERPRHWRAAMYDGAAELLRDLKPRRILGAITNGPAAVQRPKLEALQYREYFPEERVFVSGEFGARKPDPSIFLAAAKAAGLAPTECVMVGDTLEFDIPAKAVGFRTILFLAAREKPDFAKFQHQPDAIATSYAQIRKLLM